jgi:hypothetical protein
MIEPRAHTLVLQEFRLSALDVDGTVSRLVDAMPAGLGPTVPLLTSIDDQHDVAVLRTFPGPEPEELDGAERSRLDPFVATWQSAKRYHLGIAERSQSPPTHYRLAVTESGINDEARDAPSASAPKGAPVGDAWSLDLLWIGRPPTSHGGLLILLGDHRDEGIAASDARDWPLAMSRRLGVRIYDSGT